jgi:hypothetical protein
MKHSKRKLSRRLIIFSAVILLLLPGLVVTWLLCQRYPSEWASLADTNRCNISGVYSNMGENIDATPLPLVGLLHNASVETPEGDVTTVQITQPDDNTLEFAFWRGKELIQKRARLQNKRDYHCSSKGIGFTFSETATRATSCEWKRMWGSYFFSKGADGSLVVHKSGFEAGLLLVVPIVGPDSLWYKFEKADGL